MNYNLTIDEAVDFLLTKSRDEKENQSKYLGIIKLLYSLNNNNGYYFPNITYCNKAKESKPDWELPDWTVTSSNHTAKNDCINATCSTTDEIKINNPPPEDLARELAQKSFEALDVFKIKGETNNEPDELPF